MDQGNCTVKITGYLVSDYLEKWKATPMMFFLRSLFDRFIWKFQTYKAESGLKEECEHLAEQIRSFLNLYRNQ